MGPLAVMVPHVWAFAGQLHVDWLSLPPVRAEVAAAVLELLQVFDGVGATGSGHSPHAKWQGHLCVDTYMRTYFIYSTCLHLSVYQCTDRWFELDHKFEYTILNSCEGRKEGRKEI